MVQFYDLQQLPSGGRAHAAHAPHSQKQLQHICCAPAACASSSYPYKASARLEVGLFDATSHSNPISDSPRLQLQMSSEDDQQGYDCAASRNAKPLRADWRSISSQHQMSDFKKARDLLPAECDASSSSERFGIRGTAVSIQRPSCSGRAVRYQGSYLQMVCTCRAPGTSGRALKHGHVAPHSN